jgi:hypothetical protein
MPTALSKANKAGYPTQVLKSSESPTLAFSFRRYHGVIRGISNRSRNECFPDIPRGAGEGLSPKDRFGGGPLPFCMDDEWNTMMPFAVVPLRGIFSMK